MKRMKVGIVLLALLLAAGVIVPIVNALPQATDIEGRSDWAPLYTDVPVYAKNTQNSMGYSAISYLQPAKSTVLSRLSSDSIFHFNGHGDPGKFYLVDLSTPITGTELNSHSYPNMKFALFQSCFSGQTSSQDGNLVASIVGHGSGRTCAFGYSQELQTIGGAIQYAQGFWDAAAQGNSPSSSHYSALNRILTQGECTQTSDHYCHYTTLVTSGLCSSSLIQSKGTANSADNNNSLSTKKIIPDKILLNSKEKIQEFTGVQNIQTQYLKTETGRGMDHYSFSSDIGQFTINSETGRVEFAHFNDKNTRQNQKIGQNQAYKIAESYMLQKYPAVKQATAKTDLKNTYAELNQHNTSDSDYVFVWREKIYSDNPESVVPYEITGLNSTTVIISSTGQIRLYSEYIKSYDTQINTTPTITEKQAWDIAKAYYVKQGINMNSSATTNEGLWIWDDSTNAPTWKSEGKQYLAWVYYVIESGNVTKGGQIAIDSHDGHIINYDTII